MLLNWWTWVQASHGILQARILEWIAMLSSRGSSQPRDLTEVSYVSCFAGGFFTTSVTWEVWMMMWWCHSEQRIYTEYFHLLSAHLLYSMNLKSLYFWEQQSSADSMLLLFSCSIVSNSETPRTPARQVFMPITNSWSLRAKVYRIAKLDMTEAT